MKQLNQAFRKIALGKTSVKNKPKQQRMPRYNGISSANIPLEVAYTVKQTTKRRVITETAREYIGEFTISPSSLKGDSMQFKMNPLLLSGTRIQRLASNYQKFRFTKLALTVQSSTTTSTNGLFIVGYNSNPDAEYSRTSAVPAIMDLPGSISTNIWRTVTCSASLQDRSKWYNIDADSEEIMDTTQGYFALVVQSPPNITAGTSLSMPVMLDYTVQFSGSALLDFSNSPILLAPAGRFAYNSATGNFTFTADSGEQPLPSTTNGQIYVVNPEYPITTTFGANVYNPAVDDFVNPGNSAAAPQVIGALIPTALSWAFYRTVDDALANEKLVITESFTVMRSTWQAFSPN